MFMFSSPAVKNIPSVLTLSFTQLGQITPVIVFEIACHHLIETFSSVFSQGELGELVFHPSPQTAFVGRDERRAPLKTPA